MGKRSADGAAEAARATQKKSKGRMEAIATTDAEQQARTKPEKRVRVGHREPTTLSPARTPLEQRPLSPDVIAPLPWPAADQVVAAGAPSR